MTGTRRIEIRRSIWSTSFALIPGLAFLGLGLAVAIRPIPAGPGLKEGLICGAIGVVWLFFTVREMADRQPYIIIDDKGLRAISLSMKLIPWSEMRGVTLISSKNGAYLQIDVDDPDRYFEARRGYTKVDRWMDRKLKFGGVSVGVSGLEMPVSGILALVRDRIDAEQSKYPKRS